MNANAMMTDAELERHLAELNQGLSSIWRIIDNKIFKEFVFKDFISAFGFMTQCAMVAEKMNHHPEWFNVYKKVRVELTTHEAGGITMLDFELARKMETLSAACRD